MWICHRLRSQAQRQQHENEGKRMDHLLVKHDDRTNGSDKRTDKGTGQISKALACHGRMQPSVAKLILAVENY